MHRRLVEAIPIVSHYPMRAASFFWQGGNGRRALTVVCKATYELRPEVSPLAKDQDDIHTENVHWGGDERNSLWAPSDLVPFKRRVDVLVTGHVYPPREHPVRVLTARLVAGAVSKTIVVHGDRVFLPNGEFTEPAELKKRIPLCWERAAGGPGTSNPVGVAPNPFGSEAGRRWAPNVQPPGIYVASARDPIPPAGLGPLAPEWPDRAQKLGRFAASWDHRNWRAHPLPDDIDAGYFNSAPPDQQADHLAPDERIVLENLHPEFPRLVTRLDGVVPHAVLRRPEQPEQPINLRCDTLWIDTDRSVCCVTWRGSIPLEVAEGAEIHITAAGGRQALSPAVSGELLDNDDDDDSVLATLHRGALIIPGSVPASVSETITGELRPFVQEPPLPFVPAAPGAAPSLASPVASVATAASSASIALDHPGADVTGTLLAPLMPATKDLPFGRTGSQGAVPPEPIAPPIPPAPPPYFAVPLPPALVGPVEPASEQEPPSQSDARTQRPPPPPVPGASAPAPQNEPAPAQSTERTASAVDPEAFPIEQWAEISAEIDKAERPRAEVLCAHDLAEHDFAEIDRHWKAALGREAASSGFSLRFKHDAAYVGALERLRGRPLSASEYAQILAAAERRQVAAALRNLEMPAAAHLPIMRQWTAKLARDPRLSFEMIQAVAALREGATGPAPATS